MTSDKESFKNMALLTGARIFGILFSLFIPMYLGRKLSVETYGTYKQIMLVFWFAQVALNLGVDDSAYYHLRKNPKHFPYYSFNALIFNILTAGLIWIGLVVFKNPIATLVKNPDLIQYLFLTGLLLFLTICSMQIEGILIGLNRMKDRLFLEVGVEVVKSAAILFSFLFFNSISAVLISLSIIMGLKFLYTIYTIDFYRKRENLDYRNGFHYLKEQIRFGLPLGVSRVLQNLLNIENFFISSYFSLVQFTYYSIGCFENPIINAARTSLYELVNIELIDAEKEQDHKKSMMVWKRMNRKLFLIVIPFVIYMLFFAKELITFVFSEKYLASVPFFMIFNFYILAGCLNPEPLFRATNHTKWTFHLRLFGLFLGATLIFLGAYYFGALYALAGKTIALLIVNIIGLSIGAKLIKVNLIDLFDWNEIFKIIFISTILSTTLRFFINYLELNWMPFFILALTFSIYAISGIIFSMQFKVIKDEEKEFILTKLKIK
jgi:O-antigen/teichoic acid export membrane protein